MTTPAASGEVDTVTWDSPYGEPPSLDYIQDAYYPGAMIIPNLCDSLFMTDQRTDEVKPGIATDVQEVGDKKLVYTIRKGVKFWDGTELTPNDVVVSLLRSKNDPMSGEGAFFRNVKTIKQTGTDEVTVTFSTPDPMFRTEMENSPMGTIASADYMKEKGNDYGSPTGGIMCSGAYKLTDWEPGNQIVMEPNPDYWDKNVTPLNKKWIWKFVTSSTALSNALTTGEIDGSYEIPPAAIPQLDNSGSGRLAYGPSTQEWMIIPMPGPMSNPDIRKALSLSIDRQAMLDSIFSGEGNVVTTFDPPSTWGYAKDTFEQAAADTPGAEPDIEAAKELVASAGPDADEQIVVAVQNDSQVQQQMATAIQDSAKEIGLDVKVQSVSATQISNAELNPDARTGFDALLFNNYFNIADPLDEAFFYVGSDEALAYLNLIDYKNEKVNQLLDQASEESDPEKRAELYTEAHSIWIGRDQALIPLVNADEVSYGNDRITGWPTSFPQYSYPWAAFVGAP